MAELSCHFATVFLLSLVHSSTLRHGFRSKAGFPCCSRIDNESANLSASFFPDGPDIGQCRRTRVRTKVALAGTATGRFVSVEDGNDRHAAGG